MGNVANGSGNAQHVVIMVNRLILNILFAFFLKLSYEGMNSSPVSKSRLGVLLRTDNFCDLGLPLPFPYPSKSSMAPSLLFLSTNCRATVFNPSQPACLTQLVLTSSSMWLWTHCSRALRIHSSLLKGLPLQPSAVETFLRTASIFCCGTVTLPSWMRAIIRVSTYESIGTASKTHGMERLPSMYFITVRA